ARVDEQYDGRCIGLDLVLQFGRIERIDGASGLRERWQRRSIGARIEFAAGGRPGAGATIDGVDVRVPELAEPRRGDARAGVAIAAEDDRCVADGNGLVGALYG